MQGRGQAFLAFGQGLPLALGKLELKADQHVAAGQQDEKGYGGEGADGGQEGTGTQAGRVALGEEPVFLISHIGDELVHALPGFLQGRLGRVGVGCLGVASLAQDFDLPGNCQTLFHHFAQAAPAFLLEGIVGRSPVDLLQSLLAPGDGVVAFGQVERIAGDPEILGAEFDGQGFGPDFRQGAADFLGVFHPAYGIAGVVGEFPVRQAQGGDDQGRRAEGGQHLGMEAGTWSHDRVLGGWYANDAGLALDFLCAIRCRCLMALALLFCVNPLSGSKFCPKFFIFYVIKMAGLRLWFGAASFLVRRGTWAARHFRDGQKAKTRPKTGFCGGGAGEGGQALRPRPPRRAATGRRGLRRSGFCSWGWPWSSVTCPSLGTWGMAALAS